MVSVTRDGDVVVDVGGGYKCQWVYRNNLDKLQKVNIAKSL